MKSNARMASFATGKYALRALAQSLSKEFGPQGVHIGHAIIDGAIDVPATKDYVVSSAPDSKISPEAVSLIETVLLLRACLITPAGSERSQPG